MYNTVHYVLHYVHYVLYMHPLGACYDSVVKMLFDIFFCPWCCYASQFIYFFFCYFLLWLEQ